MEIRERFVKLLEELNQGLYEKETELSLSLLAALAGESILLLGPPGVAKSMIARRLKQAFQDAQAFEYLMSRFSTPDEIFGPVSISLLKEADKYERLVKGYLPDADVVFLDEIWKAGPAIQNSLLTVMNEKLYRNGDHEIHLPLKLFIGASNELPTEGEGLEALWDRFLIRLVSTCITDEKLFHEMLLDENSQSACEVSAPLTPEEYIQIKEDIQKISVDKSVLTCISQIRKGLKHIVIPDSNLEHDVYVSDRRWKKIIHLLKTSAYLHGRNTVEPVDLFPIWHCLWNEPVERDEIRNLVIKCIFANFISRQEELRFAITEDLKRYSVRACLERSRYMGDHRDDDLLLFHDYYYHVQNHGVGDTYIFMVDFHEMKEYKRQEPQIKGILYKDPQNRKRTLIRVDKGQDTSHIEVVDRVNLYRINKNLYINGVPYPMEERKFNEPAPNYLADQFQKPSTRDYEQEIEQFISALSRFTFSLKDNLFLSPSDQKDMEKIGADLRKQIAFLRVDVEKLRN